MTTLYCSNKLKKLMSNLEPSSENENSASPLGDWNGHLFYLDRKKCLSFTNNQTYYTIFITEIVKKDLNGIQNLFYDRLTQQMVYDHVIQEQDQDSVKNQLGTLSLMSTNNDRKTIGVMNDLINGFRDHCFIKYEHLSQMHTFYENSLVNDTPVNASSRNATFPKEAMEALIKGQL